MTVRRPPPPTGLDWKSWAMQLHRFLVDQQSGAPDRRPVALQSAPPSAKASEDGILLWDRVNEYPVVSLNGEYRQVVLADGFAFLRCDADQVASAINTVTPIVFSAVQFGDRVSLGTPASRIVFQDAGLYHVDFSAQLRSTSGVSKTINLWPRLTGVTLDNSAVTYTMTRANVDIVVSRAIIIEVSAGDYLEAVFSVDDVALFLRAIAAASPVPASPAATLSITRIAA